MTLYRFYTLFHFEIPSVNTLSSTHPKKHQVLRESKLSIFSNIQLYVLYYLCKLMKMQKKAMYKVLDIYG